jgi:hypothetical protein
LDGAAVSALFNAPTGLVWSDGALYIADTGNHQIRKLADGKVTTLAGVTYSPDDDAYYGGGYSDGDASSAEFSSPTGVAVAPDGSVFVSDTGNGAIRRIRNGVVSTVSLELPGSPFPRSPRGLLFGDGRLFTCDILAGVVFSPFPAFSDVSDSAPSSDAITYVYAQRLIPGTQAGVFSPEAPITRGTLFTVMGRLYLGDMPGAIIDGKKSFADVEDEQDYTNAVNWAAEKGIAEGWNGKFAPERNITLQETAVVLYKYSAQFYGLTPPDEYSLTADFSDGDTVSAWARDAVEWAIGAGVITPEGEVINPRGSVTRAQIAQMLFVLSGISK